jgi:uncharacterized protein GlcG (DUF336 family)
MEAADIFLPTVLKETLSVRKALDIRDLAISIADEHRLIGSIVVAGSLYEICGQLTDDEADPGTLLIARGKIQTVVNSRRSSSIQRDRIIEKHYRPEDFMGRMGSLFGGGVAIFADEQLRRFVGAAAFSGGDWTEDEELARQAIVESGLFTDLEPSDALKRRNQV